MSFTKLLYLIKILREELYEANKKEAKILMGFV